MSEHSAKNIRAQREAKAKRLGGSGDPHQKVDASSWEPPEMMQTGAKTGMRPLSPRAFKSGGKVHGEEAKEHAGRKPRKASGGKTGNPTGTGSAEHTVEYEKKSPVFGREPMRVKRSFANADEVEREHAMGNRDGWEPVRKPRKAGGGVEYMNRDQHEADEKREGNPQLGALKRGGAAKHDDTAADKKLIRAMVKPEARKERATGGRTTHGNGCSCAMCEGGKTKSAYKRGGEVQSKGGNYEGGTRPTGDRIARARGGALEHHAVDDNGFVLARRKTREGVERAMETRRAKSDRDPGPIRFKAITKPEEVGANDHPDMAAENRFARKHGGKTGKTNVNVIIAQKPDASAQNAAGPLPARPVPPPMPMPPPGMPMGGGMPPGGMPPVPPQPPMQMGRKSGGKVLMKAYRSFHDFDAGSGGGKARLEKAEIEARK